MMKILFACGGTAGHINPALAVASRLKKENMGVEICFVGHPEKMEARLVPQAGFGFVPLVVEGFGRGLSIGSVKRNIRAVKCLLRAGKEVRRILGEFRPDIVMGTGGYVTGPVLREAAKQGIPTLTHEQNAYPGVTTKLLARQVDRVLLAFPAAREHLAKKANFVVTGNPVRAELLDVNRAGARKRLGVKDKVCIVSFGGSLGARRFNEAMAQLISGIGSKNLHFIHATGKNYADEFPIKPGAHLDIREYIDDMADCLAAADLVICRSGAITLTELQTVGRASVLIPSPNVTENHQYHNAMALANRSAAIVIEEKNLTGEGLCEIVESLVNDPQELIDMGKNAAMLSIPDADRRICEEIMAVYLEP
jgi:UDP-N-acetylglucosamine--N-acetylmuramyl-(pentapeptide) pyrophosphoryl-undecaprenol N-acetylglucosamine transferase